MLKYGGSFRTVRRVDGDPCQVQHPENGFRRRHSHPHRVVLVMAWLIVFIKGKQHTLRSVPKKELVFLILSGLATGGSWLCCYKALQDGLASVVVPIDKLSILVSIGFSALVFKERLSKKAALGLGLIVAGTLLMLVKLPA